MYLPACQTLTPLALLAVLLLFPANFHPGGTPHRAPVLHFPPPPMSASAYLCDDRFLGVFWKAARIGTWLSWGGAPAAAVYGFACRRWYIFECLHGAPPDAFHL